MNKLRFRSGQVHLRKVPVLSDTVIEAGDLVWLDGSHAKPASDFDWDTNLATSQNGFAAVFLGVAHQPSAVGDTTPISVDVSPESVYEFDVSTASYTLGQSLSPAAVSETLQNQTLVAAAASAAMARAAEFGSSVSRLRVSFASAFNTASVNVNAALG